MGETKNEDEKNIIPLMELIWVPKHEKSEDVVYEDTVADELFRLENEKRVQQCEVFLGFIKDMKGKDLEPYLSDIRIDISKSPKMLISVEIPLQTRIQKLNQRKRGRSQNDNRGCDY